MNCPICNRETPDEFQEKHHLVPKVKGGKETVLVCRNCAQQIHQLFSNNDLKNKLNTLTSLRDHPKMKKWIAWIYRKPNSFGVCMARKK